MKQIQTAHSCADGTCEHEEHKQSKLKQIFRHGFVTLPKDIGKPLLAGVLIAGLISAVVPEDYFGRYADNRFLAYMVMLVVGIPVYVCATASVPIAAALIATGVSPGAALVFLMTGPATNAASITTIWKVMGKRSALIYLGSVAVTAVVSGLILDYIYSATQMQAAPVMQHIHGSTVYALIKNISAAALLVLLGFALFKKTHTANVCTLDVDEEALMLTLHIEGMTCSHCAETVRKALSRVAGVKSVEVKLEGGKAAIKGKDVSIDALKTAVDAVGYKVTSVHDGYEN